MRESRIKAIIWVLLFVISFLFAEIKNIYTSYVWILVILALIAGLNKNFREYKTSFAAVGVFALILVTGISLTIPNGKLDTISLSVRNIEKHGNNVYIKAKEILDKGEITLEELDYLNKEKEEVSQWCAVFDRQSNIIGLGNAIRSQGGYVRNVFANEDKDTFNMEQRIKQLDTVTLTNMERQWLESLRSRSYEILMSKMVKEGYEKNYNFSKWKVRYLYVDLYKIIHEANK